MQMMLDMQSEEEQRTVCLEVDKPEDIRQLIKSIPDGTVISIDMEEVIFDYGQSSE